MSEKIIIHCDNCTSVDVLHELVALPPREVNLTMTEMAERSKIRTTHDVYIYRNYRMVCKDCGHIVRYQV
jgi:uncharacterized Zn finger protein